MAATMPFPNRVSPFGDARPTKEDYRADLAIRLMCPNCKEEVPNIVEEYSSGDLICGSCGTLFPEKGSSSGKTVRLNSLRLIRSGAR
jgi:transcription initiation factor TFIIB